MDDALLVRGFERFGDLSRDRQRFVERQRTLRDAVRERRALDELEHQRVRARIFLESVDRADVRMIERREQLCLALEARDAVGIGRESIREKFQRDIAVEPRIARAIHLAHAARAESRHELIRAHDAPDLLATCTGRIEQHRCRRFEKSSSLRARREQRFDLDAQPAVGPAGLRYIRLPLGAVACERFLEDALHPRPVIQLRHRP